MSIERLTPVHQNVLRNDLKISEGVLKRIDKDLNKKFLSYLEKIKLNNSVFTKLGETLQDMMVQDMMVQDIHSRVDLLYTDPQNITIMYEFDIIKKDRLVRNALNKSFCSRRGYTSVIENQIVEATELLPMIDAHLNE